MVGKRQKKGSLKLHSREEKIGHSKDESLDDNETTPKGIYTYPQKEDTKNLKRETENCESDTTR